MQEKDNPFFFCFFWIDNHCLWKVSDDWQLKRNQKKHRKPKYLSPVQPPFIV